LNLDQSLSYENADPGSSWKSAMKSGMQATRKPPGRLQVNPLLVSRPSMFVSLERLGNRLPDPVVLFAIVASLIALVSAVLAGFSVEHPLTHQPVSVQSLLAEPLSRKIWTDAVKNFGSFPPLGSVLVAVMGIGIAEKSGLIENLLGRAVQNVPEKLLTLAMLFVGANGALASDASFVILVPLGASLWAGVGRHPLAGMSIAYAAVSGGYGANLLVTALDPLLAGLTESAARLVEPEFKVAATCNWFFNIASVGLVTLVGMPVAAQVEAGFGPWKGEKVEIRAKLPPLKNTALAFALTSLILLGIVFFVIRADSWAPVYEAVVPLIALSAAVPGLVFAWDQGKIKNSQDAAGLAAEAISGMGGYIVLAFAASQFVAWFNWSNLGIVLAVTGADFLKGLEPGSTVLLLLFVVLSGVINVLIASASAKWALMAPLFVPMLMLLGIEPAMTQAAYRVGDAVTNVITPLMPYMPIVLAAARRYVPEAGLGTILAAQLPFMVVWGVAWTAMLLGWNWLGLPLGVG
jgi:aminobenzoyl-glutamate transport protein